MFVLLCDLYLFSETGCVKRGVLIPGPRCRGDLLRRGYTWTVLGDPFVVRMFETSVKPVSLARQINVNSRSTLLTIPGHIPDADSVLTYGPGINLLARASN